MKFHWFAEASYPKLPADFRAQKISSWVDTPKHLADPVVVGEMCRMFIRLMQQADRGDAVAQRPWPCFAQAARRTLQNTGKYDFENPVR